MGKHWADLYNMQQGAQSIFNITLGQNSLKNLQYQKPAGGERGGRWVQESLDHPFTTENTALRIHVLHATEPMSQFLNIRFNSIWQLSPYSSDDSLYLDLHHALLVYVSTLLHKLIFDAESQTRKKHGWTSSTWPS